MTKSETAKLPRVKTCKGCGVKFQPQRPLQTACGVECAYKVARINGTKKRTAQYRADKKQLKTRSDWLKEAQSAVNRYIRLRDAGKPCISCGRHHQGQYHAGHYRSVGANPEIRFLETNIHAQCAPCNNHLSGNIINYRLGLVARYGIAFVESLEGFHAPQHYTVEEIESIKRKYQKLARDLEKRK